MESERIIWAQENIESKSPEVWRDITVPTTKAAAPRSLPPFERKVTIAEWGEMLSKNGMVGIYRAFTLSGRLVAVIVTERVVYGWKIEEIGK